VAVTPPDAGVTRPDGGVTRPDAGSPFVDAGNVTMDAGTDAGRGGPPPRSGVQCACRAAGLPTRSQGALVLALLVGLVYLGRRRGR
jgi:hypothetical protein